MTRPVTVAALYRFAPNHRAGWRKGIPGAMAAAFMWVALAFGFRAYLGMAAGMNQIFGVLGGGLIVLVFFYLLSLALLIGGEINAVLLRPPVPPPPPAARSPAPGKVGPPS